MPSPIDSLPIEILSDIFTRLIRLYRDADWGLKGYQKCLRQALVLASVSSPFRYAAFATHDLWMRVPLVIASPKDVEKAKSLLRLCTTLAHSVQIFVNETLMDHESARSAIDILLTPDTTLKVKAFHLYESYNSTDLWLGKFQGPSFPIHTTLNVRAGQMGAITSDLTTLTTLTQLRMDSCYSPVIVPPSVQYLASINVSQHALISLFYQCPNLIECYFELDIGFEGSFGHDTEFTRPLTLTHLKRLSSSLVDAIDTSSSVQNLQLPSLEFLEIMDIQGDDLLGVLRLCRNVSATLTSLVIGISGSELQSDVLLSLCRIPFPKLTKLVFQSMSWDHLQSVSHALHQLEAPYETPRLLYPPALQCLTFYCYGDSTTTNLVDFLRTWRLAEGLYSYIRLNDHWTDPYGSLPHLRASVKSIIGSRQIEVTWNTCGRNGLENSVLKGYGRYHWVE